MWACPECGRTFRNPSQAHSCVRTDPESFFAKRPPELLAAYRVLIAEVSRFGPVRVDGVKNAIMVKAVSTFLAIKPKRDRIDIEFLLDTMEDQPPVYKVVQAYKSRVAHFVALEGPGDVTPQLVQWLRRSWLLAGG
jgi:hypothetical protein